MFFRELPILFCPSSWAPGLCEGTINIVMERGDTVQGDRKTKKPIFLENRPRTDFNILVISRKKEAARRRCKRQEVFSCPEIIASEWTEPPRRPYRPRRFVVGIDDTGLGPRGRSPFARHPVNVSVIYVGAAGSGLSNKL
ncbi:hypothetical protein J6590_022342 [Homalodisca vitripennis]|nr:hypothetical protein J6590_022342 [Homalodisca vitripennis]